MFCCRSIKTCPPLKKLFLFPSSPATIAPANQKIAFLVFFQKKLAFVSLNKIFLLLFFFIFFCVNASLRKLRVSANFFVIHKQMQPLSPCPARFCGYLIYFFLSCCVNTLFSMSVLYVLLQTGSVSAEDLGYLFAIEFIFAATIIAIFLAKQEIDICCHGPMGLENESEPLQSPLLF